MGLSHRYLSVKQLAALDRYKYSAVDTNPLSVFVMHPFWNFLTTLLPTWVAPNLLTFLGFLLLVINYLLLAYFDIDFSASAPGQKHIPAWVWVAAGILNFTAYTLDGVDGKQARRTVSSTPLGELFDHGLDSWACCLFVATVYSVFSRAGEKGVPPGVLLVLLYIVLATFTLSHFEKYNTGILFLPWGYDVCQLTISVVFVITAYLGVETWHQDLPFGILYRDVFITMIVGCFALFTVPQSLHNIYKASCAGTLKHASVLEATRPLFSPVMLIALSSVWFLLSPEDVGRTHLRLFLWTVGTVFSNIACQLIVSQMSSTRCQMLNMLLPPLALLTLASCNGWLGHAEPTTFILYAMIVTVLHLHYGICVVWQLSRHFNIRTFSLQKPNSH
uniref:ethanolaminephosphotransferase 1-like isoform X2 n=1 Tax=Myxine glutinosa TaxID=7769 RepID=UPI00358F8988